MVTGASLAPCRPWLAACGIAALAADRVPLGGAPHWVLLGRAARETLKAGLLASPGGGVSKEDSFIMSYADRKPFAGIEFTLTCQATGEVHEKIKENRE